MRALTPWTGLGSLRKDMDRLFDTLDWDIPGVHRVIEWTPALDVSETKDAFLVKAEVAGIDPKDISVSLENQTLTIKGEKKDEKEEKDQQYYRMERAYGAFARAVHLPATVDGSKVTADFKNGLLTVTLPKTASAKGSTIPIKTG